MLLYLEVRTSLPTLNLYLIFKKLPGGRGGVRSWGEKERTEKERKRERER